MNFNKKNSVAVSIRGIKFSNNSAPAHQIIANLAACYDGVNNWFQNMSERYVSDIFNQVSIMTADRLATKVARVSAGMELTKYVWHHSDITEGISNHQQLDCTMFNSLFRLKQKTSCSTLQALCAGNPPVTGGFPVQRASNAESASMSWHHLFEKGSPSWYDCNAGYWPAGPCSRRCCVRGCPTCGAPCRNHRSWTGAGWGGTTYPTAHPCDPAIEITISVSSAIWNCH